MLNPELKGQIPEELWDMLVSFEELDELYERVNQKDAAPREFTFGNHTYIHIPGTETFTLPNTPTDENGNPLVKVTPLQIMKATFAPTRSYYKRVTPLRSALMMLQLGDSARAKIIRAVQLHYDRPPVSDETDQYTPFFDFLSEGVADHWTLQQQFSSCKWATRDKSLATSMLLHYGYVPRFTERITKNSIYQMYRAQDGIHLQFSWPHGQIAKFQPRMDAACAKAQEIEALYRSYNMHASFQVLFKEACKVFFSYQGFFLSIKPDYRQSAMNKIQAYCLHLTNALEKPEELKLPVFEDPAPEDCMEIEYVDDAVKTYVLKWEDFIFEEEASLKQYDQRQVNNEKFHVSAIVTAWRKLDPTGEKDFTREEVYTVLSNRLFAKAVKEGSIIKTREVKRKGFYRINLERFSL